MMPTRPGALPMLPLQSRVSLGPLSFSSSFTPHTGTSLWGEVCAAIWFLGRQGGEMEPGSALATAPLEATDGAAMSPAIRMWQALASCVGNNTAHRPSCSLSE